MTPDPAQVGRASVRSANLPTHRGQSVRLPPLLNTKDDFDCWRKRLSDPASLIVLDLFCGAGGMSLGFANEGFVIGAGIDTDEQACETFAANFPAKAPQLDLSAVRCSDDAREVINRLDLPRVDIIVGGPPCQGFSVVGRARIRALPEKERRLELLRRNELYAQFFHFVAAAEPLMFIMENVQTMTSWEDGVYFQDMLDRARDLHYETFTDVLDARDYGVPQARRRQFIVGSPVGRVFRFPIPRTPKPFSLMDAIGDLPTLSAPSLTETLTYGARQTGPYQQLMRSRVNPDEADLIHDHIVRPVRDDDRDIFLAMKPGDRYIDIDPAYQRYSTASFTDKYYKLLPDAPCVTITAHMAKDGYRYIHPDCDQCRTLSVREAARVQSFDDAFRFAGHRSSRYRQIGNAVPPLLAQEIAVRVRRAIRAGGRQLRLPLPENVVIPSDRA